MHSLTDLKTTRVGRRQQRRILGSASTHFRYQEKERLLGITNSGEFSVTTNSFSVTHLFNAQQLVLAGLMTE